MKIEINPDGTIEIDTENVAETLVIERIHQMEQGRSLTFNRIALGMYIARISHANAVVTDNISLDVIKDVLAFLRENKKLNAVKLVKDATGLGLKESKAYVDMWQYYTALNY